jgi:hypothetical protein
MDVPNIGDGVFTFESFHEAMALVRSGADVAVEDGLARLRLMSGRSDAPHDDIAVAATEADGMLVLMRVLETGPATSGAIQSLTWLLANLAVAPVGCQLLMSAGALPALGAFIEKYSHGMPLSIVDNALIVVGNVAGEGYDMTLRLFDEGSIHNIVLRYLNVMFSGEPHEGHEVYNTLAWVVANLCRKKSGDRSGYLPYPLLKPLLPHIAWALDNLTGASLTDIGWALSSVFDEGREGVEWLQLYGPEPGFLKLVLGILCHPDCRGASPTSFVRVIGKLCALDSTVSVFSTELVKTLADLLGHPLVLNSVDCLRHLIWALSNLAAEPQHVATLLRHPGPLPEMVKFIMRQLARAPPRSTAAADLWKTASEMLFLLGNLAYCDDNTRPEATHHLLAWGVAAWAAVLLRIEPPRTALKDAEMAFHTKTRIASLILHLIQRGTLEPDEAYGAGEDGPNAYFSQFAATGRLYFLVRGEVEELEQSPEKELLDLSVRLAGPHVKVKYVNVAEYETDDVSMEGDVEGDAEGDGEGDRIIGDDGEDEDGYIESESEDSDPHGNHADYGAADANHG